MDAADPEGDPDALDPDAPGAGLPEEDSYAADPDGPVWWLDGARDVADDPDGDRAEGSGDAADPSVEATWDTSPCRPLAVGVEASGCGSDPPELLPVEFASSTRSC